MTATTQDLRRLRKKHAAEERKLVRDAVTAGHGRLALIAERLGVAPSTVQRLIERHGLADYYAKHTVGRGRPQVDDD